MKNILSAALITVCILLSSCSSTRSGGSGITGTEISTITQSFNEYDLVVDPQGITYTIDISTPEGRLKLNGLSLKEAYDMALREAAQKYDCARILNPDETHFMKGKKVLRITVHGFPARFKNSSLKDKLPENNVIIVK